MQRENAGAGFFIAIQAPSEVRKGYLLAHSSHAWFDRFFFWHNGRLVIGFN
jgi:hypothetical protein